MMVGLIFYSRQQRVRRSLMCQLRARCGGDQVTYILPLLAGVVPDAMQEPIFAAFEENLIAANQGHLSTGLSGTYLMIRRGITASVFALQRASAHREDRLKP